MNGGGQVSGVGCRVSDDTGLVVLRVVCNPFRVGARVGEVPVAARGLPPAIFCQPCGLKLGPWETGAIHLWAKLGPSTYQFFKCCTSDQITTSKI